MLHKFNSFLSGRKTHTVVGLSIALIFVLALMDHLTGYEISFSVFYLIPISIGAWYGGRRVGYTMSGMSATAWAIVEYTSAQPYSQDWILYWNSGVRLMLFFVVAWLLAELKAQLKRQQQLATTDNLTGLLNRSGFFERAKPAMHSAHRYGYPVTIAFIDLDGFKNVNDSFGHAQGDEALKAVGRFLSGSSRDSDIVARYGGDEFAVLLPHTGMQGSSMYFRKLQRELKQHIHHQGWPGLGLSIGAVVFDAAPTDVSEALRLADNLMYRVKKGGKAGVIVEHAAALAADTAERNVAQHVDSGTMPAK